MTRSRRSLRWGAGLACVAVVVGALVGAAGGMDLRIGLVTGLVTVWAGMFIAGVWRRWVVTPEGGPDYDNVSDTG